MPKQKEVDAVDTDGPVRARWVDVQSVFVPDQGLVRYGDEIWVWAEQLVSAQHPTVPWSDDWVADQTLADQAVQEG